MADRRIGILGSGDVAKALGRGFARYRWKVKRGTRSPENLRAWATETEGSVSVGSFSDAASFGDVVVLSVLGTAVGDVLELAGPENFDGKLVLDTTNPLGFSPEGPPNLLFGGTDSLGERVQATLSGARVVKVFQYGFERPDGRSRVRGRNPTDDDLRRRRGCQEANRGYSGRVRMAGRACVGPIESSRYLEALVPLWIRIGLKLDTWKHAFTVAQ